jgi:hypothetical protein
MEEVFNMERNHPGLSGAQMHWKYWRESSDWVGSRSFVMEREGTIIAHGAVVPLECAWGDRKLNVVHLIDWAARRDCTGAGITLMRRVGEMTDGVFAAGGSESTQKILPALGFKPVGTATAFLLPLRPLVRIGDSFRHWRSAARLGRGLLLSLTAHASGAPPHGWSVRPAYGTDVRAIHFPNSGRGNDVALFSRTEAKIADLLQCPIAPGQLYIVERNGRGCGYFVLTLAGKQCRLAEAWVDSNEAHGWQALYKLAIQQAKADHHLAELAAVASTPVEIDALQSAGFPIQSRINLQLWMRNGKVPQTIRYQMVDGDAAYLHDGF